MHTIASTKTMSWKTQSTAKLIFSVDFKCKNTCAFALLTPSLVTLSTFSWSTMVSAGVGCRCSQSAPQLCECWLMGYRQIVSMSTWRLVKARLWNAWKFCCRNHSNIWGGVLKKTNPSWCWLSIASGRSPWFFRYVRKHWLYTLGMEELSFELERTFCKRDI